jgi:Lipocalin-like domain
MSHSAFVGIWHLVAANFFTADGTLRRLYGDDPLGFIEYDAHGRMSVQIMVRRRPARPQASDAEIALADYQAILRGYIAYFGTYDVDENSHTITHHIQGSLVPEWVDTDLKREYEFNANRLTLRFAPTRLRGEMLRGELIWEKVND